MGSNVGTVCWSQWVRLVNKVNMVTIHEKKMMVTPLTEEELDALTIVFHQFETGLREGTIYTRVNNIPDTITLGKPPIKNTKRLMLLYPLSSCAILHTLRPSCDIL